MSLYEYSTTNLKGQNNKYVEKYLVDGTIEMDSEPYEEEDLIPYRGILSGLNFAYY